MDKQLLFMKLTDPMGEPMILSADHITAIVSESGSEPVDAIHKELDPDCKCSNCIGHAPYFYNSLIVTDIMEYEICEEHGTVTPHLTHYPVRESLSEISDILANIKAVY